MDQGLTDENRRRILAVQKKGGAMRYVLMWLVGIPIPILIILYLLGVI
jgi:hypothetical protein